MRPVIVSQRMTPLERKLKQTGCDVRFDNLSRQLYATDASIYQIQPTAVAFPRSSIEASSLLERGNLERLRDETLHHVPTATACEDVDDA